MKQYNVNGMSCAACVARVEKAVSQVEGVDSCSVSLLTNSMALVGEYDEMKVLEAVKNAGYEALPRNSKPGEEENNFEEELVDRETPALRRRLIASLAILLPLMYVSMGHMMWDFPLPRRFSQNCIAIGSYEMLLSAIVMVINRKFFVKGFAGLIHKAPNMDTLVAMGSMTSFVYSVGAFAIVIKATIMGDSATAIEYMGHFYFESAAMILTLITVGKLLEAKSKGKTTDALKGLMKLAPEDAVILVDGRELTVPISDVKKGDRFVVKPGDRIPVDGYVLEGTSAVNEASITGESIPVDKKPGDEVVSATINQSGHLVCEATKVGEDTTLSRIISMVSDAAASKAPIAKLADKVSGVFVPIVLGISLVTFAVWLLCKAELGFAVARAVSVLVISCPCTLGLATPVAIMVGNGIGAKHGILFKTAASLEMTGKVNVIALDKTGTVTKGEPEVTEVIAAENSSSEELLMVAYSLERLSEHPLAKAIVEYAKHHGIVAKEAVDFLAIPGSGLKAKVNGKDAFGGNYEYIKACTEEKSLSSLKDISESLSNEGKTPLFFAYDGYAIGLIAVSDNVKEDSKEAIEELKEMGLYVVMLTGDNERTAGAVALATGVDEVAAGVRPGDKANLIQAMKQHGRVAMVGDGINDAPALTGADIGIAIGAGTDIAIDSAEVVLMKNSLKDVAAAIRLSRATLKNIKENLFWAFFYNIIGIPLAAGVYIKLLGWQLNPMFGAAAMSLSSFFVVTNALRLNFLDIYKKTTTKRHKIEDKILTVVHNEEKVEKTVMKIEVKGMMCMHCEKHVKASLEKIEGVMLATPSHETGIVELQTSGSIDMDAVKAAIEDAGYEYLGEK